MRHYNIPIFINHFGCPQSCVFCNQVKINGRETDITSEDIRNTIECYLETLPKNSNIEVAFFGGTFTGISNELQKEYLETAYEYIKKDLIKGIRISTRPDCIDRDTLIQLKKYGVTSIELGIQSLDRDVLIATKRYYDLKIIPSVANLIKSFGFELGMQMMIGLPGSTYEKDILTAQKIMDMKPDTARIYPTLVIKGTELETMLSRQKYKPLSMEEAIKRTSYIVALFELNDIKIIRIGLQPSDDLTKDGVIIGGPFHSAFREVVESEIYYNFLKEFNGENCISVESQEKNVSKIVGLKKINRLRLGKDFSLKINNSLKENEIIVNGISYFRDSILKKIMSNI